MLLTGTFVRSLDEKQRFAIPKPLREAFGQGEELFLYLAPGTDGSLALYSEQAFSKLADQMGSESPNAQETRAFSRLFYAQAQRLDVDRQGRVRLPVELARWAHLDKEIVLLGVRDHLEIWNRDRWEGYLSEQQTRYDELAESAFARPAGTPPSSSGTPTAESPESSTVDSRTARRGKPR